MAQMRQRSTDLWERDLDLIGRSIERIAISDRLLSQTVWTAEARLCWGPGERPKP